MNVGVALVSSTCLALGLASISPGASAQGTPERVIITGSSIPRTEVESVQPVQIITREEIERSGAITAAEFANQIGANMSAYVPANAIGDAARPGFAGASLRGLGASNTLILLNGRRMTNHAFDGGGVDLNTIPLAAIDRVEVLLGGASHIYGTDAIGGVINFITRTDYSGAELSLFSDMPQQTGGSRYQTGLAAGKGNVKTDGFNLFGSVDFTKQQGIRAIDRDYAKSAFRPDLGVNKLSGNSIPANILTATGFVNPSRATGCLPPFSIPTTRNRCGFDYASVIDILPPQEKTNLFLSGAFRVSSAMQFFGEFNYVKNLITFAISPTPASEQTTFAGDPLLYPAGGQFYPAGLGLAGDLNIYWRALSAGRRTDEATSKTARALGGVKGVIGGWDYNAALALNHTKATDRFTDGYLSEARLLPAMFTGQINPFGGQNAAGQALLDGTKVTGVVREATGRVPTFDVRLSKDLFKLPAGPLGFAFGTELRKETYIDDPKPVLNSGDIIGGGGNLQHIEGSRNVKALYAEASIPIVRTLEGTAAFRTDHYSDFGRTTNPMVGLKWTPSRRLGFRTSYNTGFHAPTLYDLYGPNFQGNTANIHDDPVRCPGGVPVNPATAGLDCGLQFNTRFGGNRDLTPEKSTQYAFGVIVEPVRNTSITVDLFNLTRSDTIGTLSDDLIFANPTKYNGNIVREAAPRPGDPAGLPGVISFVDQRTVNLGRTITRGLDIGVRAESPSTRFGTFKFDMKAVKILKYMYQLERDGEYFENTGRFAFASDGASTYRIVPRWRHYITGTVEFNRFGISLANQYTSGYTDANDGGQNHEVGAYSLWHLYMTYRGIKNLTLSAGVRNLLDTDPPATNSGQNFQVGYEPKFADPTGRSLFLKAVWKFL
jgi:iron complex outermembrane receptor protein